MPGSRAARRGADPMQRIDTTHLRQDAGAALVVALLTLPAAFAYAELAGLPPVAGLLSAIGGMAGYAVLASSRHVVVGPDATIALLVGAAIGPLAAGDPAAAVALAAALSLLTALMLLLMAGLRLGVAADFLSSPAMLGFLNGAAIVIVASQFGRLFGIRLEAEGPIARTQELLSRPGEWHLPTLAAAVLALLLLAVCRRLWPRVPGALPVFALAMLAAALLDLPALGLEAVGAVELTLPRAAPPGVALADLAPLFIAALGIALLIFSEGVLLGRSLAERHGYAIDPDRELLAFGAANLGAATLLGFPVGSSQTRSLLNEGSGGRSRAVGLLAALFLVLIVWLLAGPIAKVPVVAIAAILVFTAIGFVDPRCYARLWRAQRYSAVVALATTLGVLALGVLQGILLGVILSLLGALAQVVRPQDALLGRVEGSETLHDVGDDESAHTVPGLVVYRFYGPLMFANVRYFVERIEEFIAAEESPVRQLILDARAISDIDVTAAGRLREFLPRLQARGIAVVVAKAHLPLREAMVRHGLVHSVPSIRFHEQLADAVEEFRRGR